MICQGHLASAPSSRHGYWIQYRSGLIYQPRCNRVEVVSLRTLHICGCRAYTVRVFLTLRAQEELVRDQNIRSGSLRPAASWQTPPSLRRRCSHNVVLWRRWRERERAVPYTHASCQQMNYRTLEIDVKRVAIAVIVLTSAAGCTAVPSRAIILSAI